jgi:hypothetical protein
MQERIERRISRVNDSLYGLTNQLLELKDMYGVDMWSEVIVSLEKRRMLGNK